MQSLQEKSSVTPTKASPIRHDWTQESVEKLFYEPFNDLLHKAQTLHRQFFDPNEVQISTLLSIKTGSCPEDCAYCPQSAHFETGLEKESLLSTDQVVGAALEAKNAGATRFCMGAAWRQPTDKDLDVVCDMVTAVRNVGMETCGCFDGNLPLFAVGCGCARLCSNPRCCGFHDLCARSNPS